jgi:signal transduction histidine kinase
MHFTIYSFIYLITALSSIFVGILAWKRKSVVGAIELFWVYVSVAFCSTMLIFESSSNTVEGKVFWSQISYLTVTVIPLFYYFFVIRFTRLVKPKDIKNVWIYFIIPAITFLLAITNNHHHLVWDNFSQIDEKTNLITYYHGIWFWAGYVLYSYSLFFISTYLLYIYIRKNRLKKSFRFQGWLIAIAGLTPWISSLLYISKLVPDIDITTISTTISSFLFTIAILKSYLFTLRTIARDELVETLPVGLIVLDNDNKISDINVFAKKMLKIDAEAYIGLKPYQISTASALLLDVLVSEDLTSQIELSENGVLFSYNVIKKPINAVKGSRIITIYDITEQLMRQKELAIAKNKAEESDRLKSAFLANMSHEIRTPMNSIMGFISIIQEDNISDDERKEYLKIVRENGDRLLKTLNDIVDFSKIEAGQVEMMPEDFDLNEIINDIYGLFSSEAKIKNLELVKPQPVPSDVSYIRIDKIKLYSIVINLIKNALKYTEKGFIKYDFLVENDILKLIVADSGIGIPVEKQKTIFERFTQVHNSFTRSFEGAGLGLSITKGYVSIMGGEINVESEFGKGSIFTVILPVQKPEALLF